MPVKLLDYGYKSPFRDTIGALRYLAWPVAVYRVTLPYLVRNNDDTADLNAFERVTLKLLDVVSSLDMPEDGSNMNTGASPVETALAHTSCMKIDFVRTILLRLRDRGYVDENNAIIESKKDVWHNQKEVEDQNYSYVTALVFRELGCGELLPFIHIVTDTTPLKKVEEDEKKRMWHIPGFPWKDKPIQYPAPSPDDVVRIKKAMLKRSLAYGKQEALPMLSKISIVEKPECYYLNCPIAIQKGDEDYRIADPFEDGFSLVLEKSFNTLLSKNEDLKKWLLGWKQTLSNNSTKANESAAEKFWNSHRCRSLYPNLISNLHPGNQQAYLSIRNIYAAIEWALFYYCINRDFSSAVSNLEFTQTYKQQEILAPRAERLGFAITKKFKEKEGETNYIFQAVKPGKLLDFKSGKAEMATVLAIALLLDEKQNDISAVEKLAQVHPDFFWKIADIKAERDAFRHGSGKKTIISGELSSVPFMKEVVQRLQPEVQFPDSPLMGSSLDKLSDSRLDAITSLQGFFNFGNYNKLQTNARNSLVNAECFVMEVSRNSRATADASAFVSNLYAAMQATIRPHLQMKSLVNLQDSEFYHCANKRAQKAGFCSIPQHLNHVKPSMIRETLLGNDRSLGACLMAFLILADEDELLLLHSRSPSFVDDVSDIITQSGHDNQSLQLSKEEILALRKKAFHSINTLLEV